MPKQRRLLAAATALAAAGLALTPIGAGASTATEAPERTGWCPQLRLADDWYGDNGKQIQQTIDERGRCSDDYDPREKPRAVFDWDNTVIKNDISDQTIFWMLRHDKILQPADQDWHNTSRYMTDAGAAALTRACGTDVPAGEPLPTSTDVTCADELLSVRKDAETTDGDAVFEGYDHRIMEASYAWVAQINAGYRPAEVRAIARKARWAALSNPVGATQQVGSSTEVAWIRYYPQIRDLIRTLKHAGFDVWVVSASPKETADVWGAGVGVPRHHTIGIRSLTTKGVLNGHLQGCGGIADGEDAIMPYIDGKRCFINKEILGIEGKAQLEKAPDDERQALAGGDATTDVTMLRDATGVRVVLNRNKDELMCRAYHNLDGRWTINPMFIEPMPKREEPYPCSTTAYEDAEGNLGPVIDDDGNVIPDQEDTVF
ncbi:haloacid dehalogenase-like hydrolase [Nocardioidaceae bacterium SCSIO 66511]|nr:haloacid dehalogenase-like hydrolase [Nocardioidaceae bacterium SCSIO 66511]